VKEDFNYVMSSFEIAANLCQGGHKGERVSREGKLHKGEKISSEELIASIGSCSRIGKDSIEPREWKRRSAKLSPPKTREKKNLNRNFSQEKEGIISTGLPL